MSLLHYCNASTRSGEITRALTVLTFLILLNAAMTQAQEPVQKHPDDGQMVVWRYGAWVRFKQESNWYPDSYPNDMCASMAFADNELHTVGEE